MKINLSLYLLVILAITTAFGQQISNTSLENWQSFTGYQVPDSFRTNDQQLFAFLGVASTITTTDAHSGQFAALLQTIAGGATANFPGLLSYGKYQNIGSMNYFWGWPFSGRPIQMHFWYKFIRAGTDTAEAVILLSKWSASHLIIAAGFIFISSNASTYTQAVVPLTYYSGETPDTIIVSFVSSANKVPTPGTMLYIDDISLDYSTEVIDYQSQIPLRFVLYQNYPNPFNPTTNISFSLPLRSRVTIKIFDLLGREVSELVNEDLPAGNYTRQWNSTRISSGIYFYRFQAGSFTETKKLIVLR